MPFSAAKMVADSTQSELPEKVRKRKKTVVKKKVKKKKEGDRRSRRKSGEDDYTESDLDLDNDIKPIGDYVKDREALLYQLFHCIKGARLDRNLPDVLKDLPLDDLKRRCLEELEVMSKKRIRRILAGDDPGSISSSGTEDDTTEEEEVEQEVDGGQMEYEGYEAQLVDSTSQYTQGLGDSDRELDAEVRSLDNEGEGSVDYNGSSRSYTPSDNEMTYPADQEQDDDYDMYEEHSNKSIDEQYPEPDDVPGTVESKEEIQIPVAKRIRRESETTEEGEVFDDDEEEEVSVETVNLKPTNTDKEEVVELEAKHEEMKDSEDTKVEINNSEEKKEDTNKFEAKEERNDSEDKEETNATQAIDEDDKEKSQEKQDISERKSNENTDVSTTETTDSDPKPDNDEIKPNDEKNTKAIDDNTTADHQTVTESVQDIVTVEQENKLDEIETDGECVDSDNEDNTSDEGDTDTSDKSKKGTTRAKPPQRIVIPPAEAIAPVLTKNQMELLELEMRARAIKAMLKNAK